jgi:hypothetical protein
MYNSMLCYYFNLVLAQSGQDSTATFTPLRASFHQELQHLPPGAPTCFTAVHGRQAMSSIALTRTYIDVPAHIIIDPNAPQSIISTLFSSVHNFPWDVSTSVCRVVHMSCSGPILILTSDEWFWSWMPFTIKYLMRDDMLLGTDWFAACQPLFLHGRILRAC